MSRAAMPDYQTTPQLYLFSDLRSTVQQSITRRIAGPVAKETPQTRHIDMKGLLISSVPRTGAAR